MNSRAHEVAAAAARWVVEHGLEYSAAKRRAARELGLRGDLPDNELVEDEVRRYIDMFCADEQRAELQRLREAAASWMERLAHLRPHLAGAVWRGTATRHSAVQLELYCDDPKAAEIELVNLGLPYDSATLDRAGGEPVPVLSFAWQPRGAGEPVTLHLALLDSDAQRGALKPDSRGRSWRGDLAALRRLLAEDAA